MWMIEEECSEASIYGWWTVTDGSRNFTTYAKDDANWLRWRLNRDEVHEVEPECPLPGGDAHRPSKDEALINRILLQLEERVGKVERLLQIRGMKGTG